MEHTCLNATYIHDKYNLLFYLLLQEILQWTVHNEDIHKCRHWKQKQTIVFKRSSHEKDYTHWKMHSGIQWDSGLDIPLDEKGKAIKWSS